MTSFVIGALVVIVLGAVVAWFLVGGDSSQSSTDMARVGHDDDVDANEAARRAQGKTSWMRPDGGGL